MMYDLSRPERQHRAIANEKPGPMLESKRCGCGKRAFAKQLAQHGKCEACVFKARAAALLPEDVDILRHMVGATDHHPRCKWGGRNHYLSNVEDVPAIERLIAAGFVRAGATLLKLRYYHATAAGFKVVGVSAKRAGNWLKGKP